MQAPHSESSQPSFAPVRPTDVAHGREEARPGLELDGVGHAVDCECRGDLHDRGSAGGDRDVGAARPGDGDLDRPARHHLGHRAAVALGGAHVRDRGGRRGSFAGGGCDRRLVRGAAGERGLGLRHAADGRRERRDGDAGVGSPGRPTSVTTAVAPTTAISICRRYSRRTYALPVPGAGEGTSTATSSSSPLATVAPGPAKSSSTGTVRVPVAERSVTVAPRQISGPPVSIAGEAFITFPPIVPWARVACEPTIALASARAVNRSRTVGCAAISAWVTSAPRPQAPGRVVDRRGAPRRGGSRRARPAAAPCPAVRRRRGRCRRRPGARHPRAPRAPPPPWWRSRSSSAAASHTRSGVIGSRRHPAPDDLGDRVRDRARRSGRTAARPRPSSPSAPRSACPSRSSRSSISGASEAVTSL